MLNKTIGSFLNIKSRVHLYLIYNVPILSGDFTLVNIEAIKMTGMYDDDYFMYFEDWDLFRRIHKLYKTIYFPAVSVYHAYDSGTIKIVNYLKSLYSQQ